MLHKIMLALMLMLPRSCYAGPEAPVTPPPPPSYPWANGPPKSADFFPIAVWYQNPIARLGGRYATVAEAVKGENMNIILGTAGSNGGGTPWPERFGSDDGELAAVKAHGIYLIGAVTTPYDAVAPAPDSVASILALIARQHADSSFIGYNIGDEPLCDSTSMPPQMRINMVPTAVAGMTAKDPTRPVLDNFVFWPLIPQFPGTEACHADQVAAASALGIVSFDLYAMTLPWYAAILKTGGSDFVSVPNDALFLQGLTVQALFDNIPPGKPMWPFVESGTDNFGSSGSVSFMAASVAAGSTTLTSNYDWTRFTRSWIGLTVTGPGIPKGAKIAAVTDAAHAVLDKPATATGEKVTVTIGGGGGAHNNNCVVSVNLCVVQGNEMRATPEEVNASVWMTIIAGAHGIQYFCHDSTDNSYCLGGQGTPGALAVQANLTHVNGNVLRFAHVLNARTLGMCSLRRINSAIKQVTSGQWFTAESCHNGDVVLTTSDSAVPGRVLVKAGPDATYVLAQSDARSATGATFGFALDGLAGKTATVVYDSNDHYRPGHTQLGATHALDAAGKFSDQLGAFGSSYQVKIYRIG